MVVEVPRNRREVLARDQQRGGQAPQRALGGRAPLFLALGQISSPPNGICSSGTVAAAMALRFSMLDGGSRDLRVFSETSS